MGTHPIFESDFDCLTDSISNPEMDYETVFAECTKLQSEISLTIQSLLECGSEDELEEMSRVVARKLNKLGNGIRDLEQLNESGRVGGGGGGVEERRHNTQQVDAAMQRLKSDLRKRICQVEQKIGEGNRNALLGDAPEPANRDPKSRTKMSGAEAGTRLRSVNNMMGQVITQGQNTREKLVDSSFVLRATKGELASGSDHLANSKRLLDKLKRRRKVEVRF